MINWLVVLGAFYGGLTLTAFMAARGSSGTLPSPGSRWLLSGLALTTGCVAIGFSIFAAYHSLGATLTAPTPSPSSFVTPSGQSSFVLRPPSSEPVISSTPSSSVIRPPSSVLRLPSPTAPLSNNVPPRLQIPSLEIDEPIQTIPIHDGAWDLTNLGMEIGWLTTTGARPGDEWAMVFIGHMTVTAKEPGPFAYLQKIKKDAEVIYQAEGTHYIYHVESISRAGLFDVNRLYLADGDSLLLITCTDWDATQRIYTNRLVVQARLEKVIPAKVEDFGL